MNNKKQQYKTKNTKLNFTASNQLAVTLNFDGSCKDEIGKYGWIIKINNKTYRKGYGKSAIGTNNCAEYEGLIAGLRAVLRIPNIKVLNILGDSKLVIEQMNKHWRCKSRYMRIYNSIASEIIGWLKNDGIYVHLEWVPRKFNSEADELSKVNKKKNYSHTYGRKPKEDVKWYPIGRR